MLYVHHTFIRWRHNNEFVSVRPKAFVLKTIDWFHIRSILCVYSTLFTELTVGQYET